MQVLQQACLRSLASMLMNDVISLGVREIGGTSAFFILFHLRYCGVDVPCNGFMFNGKFVIVTYIHAYTQFDCCCVSQCKVYFEDDSNAILINNSTKAISLLRGMHIMQSYVQRREFTQSSGFDSAAWWVSHVIGLRILDMLFLFLAGR